MSCVYERDMSASFRGRLYGAFITPVFFHSDSLSKVYYSSRWMGDHQLDIFLASLIRNYGIIYMEVTYNPICLQAWAAWVLKKYVC